MKNFLKNAHYRIIKYYRKRISMLLDHNLELTSDDVLKLSRKMDVHICKHIKLDNHIVIKPKKIYNTIFKSKK